MKKISKLLLATVLLGGLVSCGGGTTSSDVVSTSETTSQTSSETTSEQDSGLPEMDYSSLTGEMKETTVVRIHYHRDDGIYDDWDIWNWATGSNGFATPFIGKDDFGAVADVDASSFGLDSLPTTVNYIIRKGGNSWAAKDVNEDQSITVESMSSDGIYDVYIKSEIQGYYESSDQAEVTAFNKGYMVSDRKILVTFNNPKDLSADKFHLYANDEEIIPSTDNGLEIRATSVSIVILIDEAHPLDVSKVYTARYEFDDTSVEDTITINTSFLYTTTRFGDLYNYKGDDLGSIVDTTNNKTTFKLWAPVSERVVLNVYSDGTAGTTPDETYEMNRGTEANGDYGVFSTEVTGNLHGKYYTYTVTNNGVSNEVVDPYAKSAELNGRRGMVVDFDQINEELEWDKVTRPDNMTSNVDASIYEVHVRDMTISPTSGVSNANKGKFLGLTEEGTTYTANNKTVTTGLDHIKELGITHLQIQPFYDFSSVDESKSDGYNWGYDPLNYNVPEGSYSTNPSDGVSRVKELKQMMKTLLANGIQVNMDVVYNHTSGSEDTNFEKIIPGYYHRRNVDGSYSNGSGCGNEMATENYMYRKFVIDSTSFWMNEYKLSGFRFDLMGLMDTTTMAEVYSNLAKDYPQVMVYGEPWTGGTSTGNYTGTDKSTLKNVNGVGAFNDNIRNALRGDNNPNTGWLQGVSSYKATIKKQGINGSITSSTIDPTKTINYVSCHDNYTFFDQLNKTMPSTRSLESAYRQGEAVIFAAEGIPFIQEGEDFLRTKNNDGNSYKSGDAVNQMDYALKAENTEMFEYFKELIQLRKDNKAFRLSTKEEVASSLEFLDVTTDKFIEYTVTDGNGNDLLVIHAQDASEITLPTGYSTVIFDSEEGTVSKAVSGTVTLAANQSLIIKK